jgi:hypothetical protein
MKWDTLLRAAGIVGIVAAYAVYTVLGQSTEVFVLVVLAIGTLVSPEFVDNLPIGPSK